MLWTEFGASLGAETTDTTIAANGVIFELAPLVELPRGYWRDRQRETGAFIIFEDTWSHRQDAAMSIIQRRLHPNTARRLHARTLTVDRLKNARTFFDRWHVQGPPTAGQTWALLDGAEIVAAMSFRPSSSLRGQNAVWELTRYATAAQVRGGASRLHTAFLRANPGVSELVTYADRALFTGDMYRHLGYIEASPVDVDYMVVEHGRRRHKSLYQKRRLAKRFGTWLVERYTEREICSMYGLHRVYDCGKRKFYLALD